jgi:hypothetical protein
MATTTPNYGWTVPTSTDLVKDGATAIETLGDAIDASMNTALGTKKAGLVLLNTTSFSGVASQSFNNVFNATYQNYRLIGNLVHSSAGDNINFRLRVGGADNSTSNSYIRQQYGFDNTTASGTRLTSNTALFINASTTSGSFQSEFFNPFTVAETIVQTTNGYADQIFFSYVRHNQSVSYDGFTLLPNSGTITGTVRVYGYNN